MTLPFQIGAEWLRLWASLRRARQRGRAGRSVSFLYEAAMIARSAVRTVCAKSAYAKIVNNAMTMAVDNAE